MKASRALMMALRMLTSTLAGCLGGTATTELEQQIADLQKNQDETNQTISDMNQTIE